MNEMGKDTLQGNRIYFLDNLRTFMIFLVVLLHAGIVYDKGGGGEYFWIVFDLSTNSISGVLNLILDIMVMPTIFFVSGFFAPLSLKNRSGWAFLRSRFKRLIIPWVIAVFTLIPLYKMLFLYSRNLPQESWATYFHFSNGIFSQSWLWFLPVLFLFDILYLVFAKIQINTSKITLKQAIWPIFFFGYIYLFCMDIFGGQGWTKKILIDFQNERLLIYFMIFLVGALGFKQKTFESKGKNKKLYIILCGTAWIPVYYYITSLQFSMRNLWNYRFSEVVDALLLQLVLLFSMLCLLYLTINTFRFFLKTQGKIGKELNKNSYGVYIIHPIALGGIALSMLDTTIPSLIKHLILTVATYIACNLIVSFYRKVIKSNITKNLTEGKIMKTATTALLVISLLTAAGCTKQENPAPRVSLHAAALQGSIDGIRQHIKAGSDLNEKDVYGSTPLIIAVTFDKVEVAQALIEAGADMTITNNEGATPLHIAAFFCRTDIVKALLEKGADKNAKNNSGKTALETVAGPFEEVKSIYDSIGKALGPLGFELDYGQIEMTRPKIAEMLQ
ncbi:MAG: acyltransferase family protein [Candidatus Aminicenantes bacterium]|nr:acyltransferase family protein [Candidatus Aminicenantes bacterium]